GAALGLRSLAGFGAGAISPTVFGYILDLTNPASTPYRHWGWAYVSLGLAAAMGPLLMMWLRHLPESRKMAGGRR
ncbi:MAG: MFS transporter, partial [Nitrospinota bacterium]